MVKSVTVPRKVTGLLGTMLVGLTPILRGTGNVSDPVPKKLLQVAGVDDGRTSARAALSPWASSPRPP